MKQEQAAAAVIIALIYGKSKSKEKKQKERIYMKAWLKRRKKLGFYEILLAELLRRI